MVTVSSTKTNALPVNSYKNFSVPNWAIARVGARMKVGPVKVAQMVGPVKVAQVVGPVKVAQVVGPAKVAQVALIAKPCELPC